MQHFLAELKRRRVFRAAAVYGATAFVVIQAADLMLPRLGLPDVLVTVTVVLAVLGLPLVVAMAWVFEAGTSGMQRTTPASPTELAAIVAEPRGKRWAAVAAGLVGVALLGVAVWLAVGRRSKSYDSIAVLPFSNLSGQPENEYFGDGLAEELINALSGIEGLRVPARTSSFAFKGTNTNVRVIGDTLNVDAVLEGSVTRSPSRVRITVRLIDAKTGFRIWSQPYDRPLTELALIQEAMAAEIVDALALRLGSSEKKELYRGGTKDVVAYDLYLNGRQKWATRFIPSLREAVVHFEEAIQRDSSFALAWSGLADAIDALAYRSPSDLTLVPKGKYAAQRAILLEPEMAEGWASLGVLAADFDYDLRVGELALRRAVALKPNYAQGLSWLGDLLRVAGRSAEALEFTGRAAELDPIAPTPMNSHGLALVAAGRAPEARAYFTRAYTRRNQQGSGFVVNLVAYARLFGFDNAQAAGYATDWARAYGYSRPEEVAVVGRAVLDPRLREEARAVIAEMEAEGFTPRDLARISAALGDYDRALKLLERSLTLREAAFSFGVDPNFDPVRADPRFIALLERLRMPNCDAASRAAPPPGH